MGSSRRFRVVAALALLLLAACARAPEEAVEYKPEDNTIRITRICPANGVCVAPVDFAEMMPATPRTTRFEMRVKSRSETIDLVGAIFADRGEFRMTAMEHGRLFFSITILRDGLVRFEIHTMNGDCFEPGRLAFDLWLAFARNPSIAEPFGMRDLPRRRTLSMFDSALYTVRNSDDNRFTGEIELRNLERDYTYTINMSTVGQ